ncbi:MAG: NAD(P)-binding domain-containing protein, partial [Rhodospirillales bacterium]|nr:NAD(P)-binding domain-containing protein [Rhodospirillales bacterium]
MTTEKLGFIGLGTMGLPMSLNLLNAGNDLAIWGRNPDKLKDAVIAGGELMATPEKLGEICDVIFLCVFDSNAVNEVVFGRDGIAKGASKNLMIVDHSSIHPEHTREMARKLKNETG